MFKRCLIPVLFLKDGWMVRSQQFNEHQYIGDPVHHVQRMMQWDVDELVVLDIGTKAFSFEHHRTDYRHKPVNSLLEFLAMIAVTCNLPLTFGGHISSLERVRECIQHGADKVSINTALMDRPNLVTDAAREFGSQAVVASIDYRILDRGQARAYVGHGNYDTGSDVVSWAHRAEDLGAGEILLNAIDRDGEACGYDHATINAVADAVSIPVIACGGAGNVFHFLKCFRETRARAVAAGNIFHFTENAYPNAKIFLRPKLFAIR